MNEGLLETLDVNTCWALLREVAVGRLAVVVDGKPEIFPVNHVVDHGTVVFRTADGTKLSAAVSGDVAFEADGIDPNGEAWSVVLKGSAGEIRELDDILAAADLPLIPWHGSPKHRFVRVVPVEVTGRRFAVADPAIWRSPFTLRASSSMD
jgi:hypothetical protein